jgi:VanZ family protein
MTRHRSSALPLAWGYVGLIGYASLYPFSAWQIPGVSPFAFLTAHWSRWWDWFDIVSNLLGYLPLGALAFGAMVRSGQPPWRAAATAVGVAAGLSLSMEFVQNFLPMRVSSSLDLLTNVLGAAAGALIGWGLHLVGAVDRWQTLRERWFIAHSAGGLALLLLWPFGLLFPAPVPFALGHVTGRLQEATAEMLDGTMVAPWIQPWLETAAMHEAPGPGAEWATMSLGLLAPCLVAFTITRPGWRRLVLVAGAVALGFAATTLSTALNFGPQHALAWRTPMVGAAFATGLVLAALLSLLPRRVAPLLGLMVLTALVVVVAQAPADPYFSQSLQAWEQGRFIRFHGAAQWVGWLWPYLAMAYLMVRAGSPADAGEGPAS